MTATKKAGFHVGEPDVELYCQFCGEPLKLNPEGDPIYEEVEHGNALFAMHLECAAKYKRKVTDINTWCHNCGHPVAAEGFWFPDADDIDQTGQGRERCNDTACISDSEVCS